KNRAPTKRNASSSGTSLHFLVWRTRSHNSRTRPTSARPAASSNALLASSFMRTTSSKLAEILRRAVHFAALYPVSRTLPSAARQPVTAQDAQQHAEGRHEAVKQQRQQQPRHEQAQRKHRGHPAHVQRPQRPRQRQTHGPEQA